MQIILLLLIMCVIIMIPHSASAVSNLLENPGFEDGAKGWKLADGIMQIDDSIAHTGKSSLKLSWETADKRKMAIHSIPASPGKRYLISAWMKSENVHGALNGAYYGVEWGSGEQFIGGAYPFGIGWDTEWTEIRFFSGIVPANADWAHVFVTLDWGGVGTAWIDDISVVEVDVPEVYSWKVVTDTVIGAQDSPPFEVSVDDVALKALGEDIDLSASIYSPPWNWKIDEKKQTPQKTTVVSLPTDKINEGVYKIAFTVKSRKSGRKLMAEETKTVYKRPPIQCLTVPHSGILPFGSTYPSINVTTYRGGVLSTEITDADGKLVQKLPARKLKAGKKAVIDVPGKSAAGRYEYRLKLTSEGHQDYDLSLPFTMLAEGEAEKGVVIGPDNLLRDHGKVWFPMFVYAITGKDFETGENKDKRDPRTTIDLLDHLQGTPFGVLDYSTPFDGIDATVAFADECAKRNIRLALSVKDVYPNWSNFENRIGNFTEKTADDITRSIARRLKDHPALAIYYINDELSTQYFTQMRDKRRLLHEEDPLHPTLHVHYDLECIKELAPSYDIFGPELYPWWTEELTPMVEWSDKVTSDLPETAPFWGCLWLFKDQPDRTKALAYLAMARGARGLLFYSYYDFKPGKSFERRWKGFVDMGKELESRLPVLLQPERKDFCKTTNPNLTIRTVSGDNGTWLLAVNTTKSNQKAVITVGKSIDKAEENGVYHSLSQGLLKVDFTPFQVRMIRLL